MKLSTEIHATIARLNAALLQGNEAELSHCFESVSVSDLLSQDTLEAVRARQKIPLTLFLATLAVANNVSPQTAQIWLDCYQSITKQTLCGHLATLSPRNVLRQTMESLISNQPLERTQINTFKGTHQQWQDSFELLIDCRSWMSAINFAESLSRRKIETKRWLQISKALANRFEFYVDNTGKAQTDVDYKALARLYTLCANAAKNARAIDAAVTLTYLRARCLEVAGDYSAAIAHLKAEIPNDQRVNRRVDIARCLCKGGDLPAAIAELDEAIAQIQKGYHPGMKDSETEIGLTAPKRPEPKFNVAKASLALKHMTTICEQKGLKVFLVSGTLLGYAREGKLLDHDKDIDVGIIGWESQYDICIALQASGLFTISASYLEGHKSHYIPLQHNSTGLWIDLFVYHEIEDKLVTGVDFFFGYRQTFAFTPFTLAPIKFLDVDMYVPGDTDLNLTENFGNWRIPDASYLSHLESPSTTDKGGQAHMLTARIHALGYIMTKKPVKLKKVIQILHAFKHSPWAMNPDLLINLEEICSNLEAREAKPLLGQETIAHA